MSHGFYKIISTFAILLLIGGIVMAINATSHADTSNSENNKTILQSYFLDMWNKKNTSFDQKTRFRKLYSSLIRWKYYSWKRAR